MAGKKELKIMKYDNKALYYLKFIGGGPLPEGLKSDFTDTATAARWRDMYYANALPKIKKVEVAA